MSPAALPEVESVAAAEAAAIGANPQVAIYNGLERVLRDAPQLDRAAVLAGVRQFHQQRMERLPSTSTYPDAGPWVRHALDVDRRVMELTGIGIDELALKRSLREYLAFRGFRAFGRHLAPAPAGDERCRVAFVPDTERGTIHIKNLDDPIAHWQKRPPITKWPDEPLTWDGVGSGLHIDDEPAEIFPLPVKAMCLSMCRDTEGAVQFLRRYSPFWGRANVVLYDRSRRSVAIEKCSFNFMQVYAPDRHGRCYVSGMACRDEQSPLGRYQAQRRDEYRALFSLGDDGPDAVFWAGAQRMENRLRQFMEQNSPIRSDDLLALFLTPRPQGLNKMGEKLHPREGNTAYTLATTVHLLDERRVLRWQRDPGTCQYPHEPESYHF